MRRPDVVTVAVSRVDGGVTILRVIETEYDREGVPVNHYEVTPDHVNHLISRYVADGHWAGPLAPTGWRFVPNDYVDNSTDVTFRDAWKDAGNGKPDVDMSKAREIHRHRLRRMRAPLLEQLDTEYLRADEAGDKKAKKAITQRKQALRDMPTDPVIDAAQSPDELRAAIPAALRG